MTGTADGGSAAIPRPPRAVLFDLDDTLYPEHAFVDGGFAAVGALLAARSGRPAGELRDRLWQLHDAHGRGRLFDTLVAELGLAGVADLVPACVVAYRTHPARLEPFPGVAELVAALRAAGIRTGIVTDGAAGVQHRKVAALGALARDLDLVLATDELGAGRAKPSPVPFRVACLLLDVPAAAAVYVGNDPGKDVAGAREAGLATVRIGRPPDHGGRSGPTGSAGPAGSPQYDADVTVDSFAALAALLLGAATAATAAPAAPAAPPAPDPEVSR